MALATVGNGQIVRHTHVNQIVNVITGVSGAAVPFVLTQLSDASNYTVDIRNLDTTSGYGLRVRDGSSNALLLAYKNNLVLGASAANDALAINCNISGNVYIGDSANASMTAGLTINQGANDDEILAMKSSDVAHGMTTITETDTFGFFKKDSATDGRLLIEGLADANTTALILHATGVTDDTGHTVGGLAPCVLDVYKKNGTGRQAVGTDGNLFVIQNATTTRFLFDAEGSGFSDTEWTTYDQYNDLALVADMEQELLSREDVAKTERRHMLENAGVIGKASWHMENGRPRAMVNFTKLAMLHHGALLQVSEWKSGLVQEVATLRERLALAEKRLAALP